MSDWLCDLECIPADHKALACLAIERHFGSFRRPHPCRLRAAQMKQRRVIIGCPSLFARPCPPSQVPPLLLRIQSRLFETSDWLLQRFCAASASARKGFPDGGVRESQGGHAGKPVRSVSVRDSRG